MIGEAPAFWWKKTGILSSIFKPMAAIYGHYAGKKLEETNIATIDLPVLCIGNYTLGGCGKTPLALGFAKAARAKGLKPGFVSRGYKGQAKTPHFVDSQKDTARLVGDEALLLAQKAPTMIGVDRYVCAQALQKLGCDFILMDDGFQSRRLYADYALLLIDALRGFGNGAVFPAGPLRAPLPLQLAYSDEIALIGEGEMGMKAKRLAARAGKKIKNNHFQPYAHQEINNKNVLGFAAIGNPHKLFHSIEALGGVLVDQRSYGDHHFFTLQEIKDLVKTAQKKELHLATSSKDYVRIAHDMVLKNALGAEAFDAFVHQLIVLDIEYTQEEYYNTIIAEVLKRFIKRQNKVISEPTHECAKDRQAKDRKVVKN